MKEIAIANVMPGTRVLLPNARVFVEVVRITPTPDSRFVSVTYRNVAGNGERTRQGVCRTHMVRLYPDRSY